MSDIQRHFRTCTLCEAMCGIVIEHQQEQIIRIKGDPDDPFSRGHICPKAVALQDLQDDPDRLRQPLKRVGEDWVPVSWETAFGEIEARFKAIRAQHGRNSLAAYVGNPTVHSTGAMLFLPNLLRALGGRNRYSATSVDQLPHMLASYRLFGHQALFTVPDLDRCDYLLVIGANPAASNGSLMSAGDPMGRIKALRQRGGRVIVIDPRRTETADKADRHVFIRPGSDAFFVAALLNVIFQEGLDRQRHLTGMITGLADLRQAVSGFTPALASRRSGIPAATIREIAREFAASPSACAYSRMGTSVQAHGQLATWLVQALNIVTGNLDRPGGMMFTRPAIDLVALSAASGSLRGSFGRFRSRVRGLPEFGGELPVAALAEEILTPGEGQVRGLLTHAGNPVLSTPDGRQLAQALDSLECYVAIDYYLNETTRHAHYILPPSGPLERPYYDLVLNLVAVRNVAKYSPALLPKAAGTLHDWQIMQELTVRLGTQAGSPARWQARGLQRLSERMGIEGVLDLLLKTGPYGRRPAWLGRSLDWLGQRPLATALTAAIKRRIDASGHAGQLLAGLAPLSRHARGLGLDRLREHPHGLDLGPLQPVLPERLFTADKTIHLSPPEFVGALADLEQATPAESPRGPGRRLLVIGRRHVRSNNSWMHNSQRLVKGKDRCTVILHPQDAQALALSDGQTVTLRSQVGEISLPVQVSDGIMPGVASVPHGWGHNKPGTRLSVAEKHAGASLNDLTDSALTDPLNGVAVLNGFWVRASNPAAA